MHSDFDPIIHKLKGRTVKVWAVADVHIGSRECDMDGFKAFLDKVSKDGNAYIVLVGDIINNGVKDSLTNVYEETMPPSCQIEKAVELLTPVKDKILGAVGGNHCARSRRAVDLDPMHTICVMLSIGHLYRTNFAMLRVILAKGNILLHAYDPTHKRAFYP